MERRTQRQRAHGTRVAHPFIGIAEVAIAPEASSTTSDTLSTKLASERTPNPIESKPKSPMIEIIEAIDSSDEHNGGEHGMHATAPSVELSFDYSLDAAGDVVSHKAHVNVRHCTCRRSSTSHGMTRVAEVVDFAQEMLAGAAIEEMLGAAIEEIHDDVAPRHRAEPSR